MSIEDIYLKMKLNEAAGSRAADSQNGDGKSPEKLPDQHTAQPGSAKLGPKVAASQEMETLAAEGPEKQATGSVASRKADVKGRTLASKDGDKISDKTLDSDGVKDADIHGDQGEYDGKPKTYVADMLKKSLGEADLQEKTTSAKDRRRISRELNKGDPDSDSYEKAYSDSIEAEPQGKGSLTRGKNRQVSGPNRRQLDKAIKTGNTAVTNKAAYGTKAGDFGMKGSNKELQKWRKDGREANESVEELFQNFIAEYEAVLEENGIYEYDEEEAIDFFVEQYAEILEEDEERMTPFEQRDAKGCVSFHNDQAEEEPDLADAHRTASKMFKTASKSGLKSDYNAAVEHAKKHGIYEPLRDDDEEDSKEKNESFQFKLADQLGSLLESEGLTDEFKSQATTIFEAAVNAASKSHIESIQEQLQEQFDSEIENYKAKLDEQVEKYLDYVVEEWVKENRLAVESASRNNIAESFMSKLKDLLEEHYVQLPEEKADLYEMQVAEAAELETELNQSIEAQRQLSEQVKDLQKKLVVESYVRSLSEIEAEKIRELAEGVEFSEGFENKLKTLKENFFPSRKATSAQTITEDVAPVVEQKVVSKKPSTDMDAYLSVVSKMGSFAK